MNLPDVGRKVGSQGRNLRRLIETRGHDDVARAGALAVVKRDEIAPASALDPTDPRAITNRQLPRKVFEISDDFIS